ncbi:MAG: isoprenylcysteine carboxylmethyltransferase family protein [Thermodesulfobacteriota bacterium]|nr:isoprenylcysteine carboxylmethyltransferase family protein [Thermodesulfobacteriota bacterium]
MHANTAAATLSKDSPGVNLMPPTVFYTCLIVGGACEFLCPQAFPLFARIVRIVLGLVLAGVGFAFMALAHEQFKRLGTNVPTNRPANTLVTHGAYRFSRNPMYVGGSAFFLGIGLAVGSLWMLAAYLPLACYLSLWVIPREEDYMERTYGDQYRKYSAKVRRWV